MNSTLKKLWVWYIIVFGAFVLIYNSINTPVPSGEWDDYTLPIASVLNDGNFSIVEEDLEAYKGFFPRWAVYVDSYELSGFSTKDGSGELTWYFPIYSLLCIPFTLLLELLELPTTYTFPFTNLTILLISLLVMCRYLNCDEKTKLLLMVLLSVNPVVFYIGWTSAEVFVYALLVMGLTFWHNQWYKRAAFFVSLAGMMNPTIMSIGIVMILEYIICLIRDKRQEDSWGLFVCKVFPNLITYGCCYIIGIVPMIYNLYHTGHINLTAAHSYFTVGNESILARFISYLFDLNYGILPYFTVILCLGIILLIPAVARKHVRYLQWMGTFVANVVLYSIMVHINSGMSGIARYNVWGVLPLIFSVVLFGQELARSKMTAYIMQSLLCIGAVLTGAIVFIYGPFLSINTVYTEFTPIAEWVMNRTPQYYNPLHSTFNSRVNHLDAGYLIETPVIYVGEDGYVRKILAAAKDKEQLYAQYQSYASEKGDAWFADQLNELGDSPEYISIPGKYKIANVLEYSLGDSIVFAADGFNASGYVPRGLGVPEEWGAWTEGKIFILRVKVNTDADVLRAEIPCGVYNQKQAVTVYVNNQQVYDNPNYLGEGIQFKFENPRAYDGILELRIEIPEAISPSVFGYEDVRVLGLCFYQIVISAVE